MGMKEHEELERIYNFVMTLDLTKIDSVGMALLWQKYGVCKYIMENTHNTRNRMSAEFLCRKLLEKITFSNLWGV